MPTLVLAFNKPKSHYDALTKARKSHDKANRATKSAKTADEHGKAAKAHHDAANDYDAIHKSEHSSSEEKSVAKSKSDEHRARGNDHEAKSKAGGGSRLSHSESHGGGGGGGAGQNHDQLGRFASLHVRAYAFRAKEPPAEIQLWNVGDNPTDMGNHIWSARSAAVVEADYERRGNLIQLDVEHNAATPADPSKPPPTAGYARLEIRAGAPWLVFDWSDYGAEQIRTGQRLYLSPEYFVDKTSGEIVGLARVSLVAAPATHHSRMLASATPVRAGKGQSMDPKQIAEALDALIAGDEAKCAELLKGLIAAAAGGAAAPPSAGDAPPPPMPEEAAAPPPAAPPAAGGATPAEEEPKKVAAAKPAPSTVNVVASPTGDLSKLAERVDAFERDRLLEKHGNRLAEPQRVWASKQPLAVVKSLIDASPEPTAPATRVAAATRGAGQGKGTASALPPAEKAALDAAMGLGAAAAPIQRVGNTQTFRPMTPEQARKHMAARAAAKIEVE